MNNFDIMGSPKIKKNNLSKYNYTLTLIRKALSLDLITPQEVIRIKYHLFLKLKELILRYTRGESTSVKVEIAEQIQSSILYALDTCLYNYSDPEEAIRVLKKKPFKFIYEGGINLLNSTLKETENLYNEVNKTKLNIPLEIYNYSIDEALPIFFNNYDLIYDAQNTMTMIDYPLIFDDMKVQGVFYINNYLQNLNIENKFCSIFKNDKIKNTLRNYGRIYNIDYKQLPVNVFEILINNCIFSLLLVDINISNSNDIDYLYISESKFELIKRELISLTQSELKEIISNTVEKLIKSLFIKDKKLINYIRKYNSFLVPRVINAVENNSLHNIIIIDTSKTRKETTTFVTKDKMSDSRFRQITNEIRNCSNIKEKIYIITKTINSFEDLIDTLEADCLFGKEFIELFDNLTDIEVVLLAKRVFYEEIRIDDLNFTAEIYKQEKVNKEWEKFFINFINNLDRNKRSELENQFNMLIDKPW